MADSGFTKNALAASLKQLMSEKSFDKISVSDICERCGMNRKSFYYHFRDKYDLVNWIFTENFLSRIHFSGTENGWDLLQDCCLHFYEDRAFYRDALRIEGQNSFHDYVLETMRPIAMYLARELHRDEEVTEFFVRFFGDAYLSAIMRWFSEDMEMTPQEFVDNLRSVCRGLAGVSCD